MARRRDYRAEAARRNELARSRGKGSSYEQRIERARKKYPGISKGAARGHGTASEKAAMRLIDLIPKLPPDTEFSFFGDRGNRRDGTWETAVFDVLKREYTIEEPTITFRVGPSGHYLLPNVANALRDAGWAALGAKYMSEMVRNKRRIREGVYVAEPGGPVYKDGVEDGRINTVEMRNLKRSLRRWRRV